MHVLEDANFSVSSESPLSGPTREFGKYKGNGNGNMVINNTINPERQS